MALALGSVLALAPRMAHAAFPGGCSALGIAITEHSCFHSEFGPFTTVMATAGSAATPQTADVSPVHTEYRVGLTGEYSVVTYTPLRTGAWAVLLGEDLPFQLLAGKAEALPSMLDQAGDTGCAALPVLHVFELTASTKYRLVFGPTSKRTAVAVIEYIDDFLTENGRDSDADGFGSQAEVIVTPCKPPDGFAPNTRDCDDADPLINPNATEVCDGVDQNCNGVADDVGLACRVGVGACRVEGKTECGSTGSEAVCSVEPSAGTQEKCNGVDDDCNGKIDDAPGLCTDPARPTCIRSGMTAACGCQLDLDCGAEASGRVCNVAEGKCEDGCSTLPGRNGCAEGETCGKKTSRCETVSSEGGAGAAPALVPEAIGGAGGEGAGAVGDRGLGDATEGGEPSAASATANQVTTKSSGCDCAVAGVHEGSSRGLLALAVALALWFRRRRRSLAGLASLAVIAGSLLACGGRVQDAVPSSAGGAAIATGGHLHDEPTAGRSAVAPVAGGGVAAGGGAAAAAGGAAGAVEPDCDPALGDELIEHACSHATNGPFVPVVTGGDLPPPDVSELHHTYEVQVVGAGASLSYRAQRKGSHAFMTDRPLAFSLLHEGQVIGARPSFDVAGCPHLTRATVYDLEPEADYELRVQGSASEFELFFEHLGAFGSGAWSEECSEALP